jgi:LysM repeat protein
MFSNGKGVERSETSSIKAGYSFMPLKVSSSWSRLKATFDPWLKSVSAVNINLPFKIKSVRSYDVLKDRLGQMLDRKFESEHNSQTCQTKVVQVENETTAKLKSPKTYIFQDRNIEREEHDFKESMNLTSQSINEYFKTMTLGNNESLSGFDNLSAKKYEPQSYVSLSRKVVSSMLSSRTPDSKDDQRDRFDLVKSLEPLVDRVMEIIPAEYRKRNEPTKVSVKKKVYSKTAVNSRTRALVQILKTASSDSSRLVRMEELSKHLLLYPESCGVAVKVSLMHFC